MNDPTHKDLVKRNIRCTISYDGTHYLGWQATGEGPSIESTLQAVIEKIIQHPISLQAASRTDAGVHAEEQVLNFFLEKPFLNLHNLQKGINALLPPDIVLLSLEETYPEFHPTLDNIGKEYHYHLCFHKIMAPLKRHYIWHYPYELDVTEMQRAIPFFLGTHRFAALRNSRKDLDEEDDLRTIHSITLEEIGYQELRFIVRGDHFLYKMVRNLVGTLVYVGRKKIPAEEIPDILASRDRKRAGITAPAHGLILKKVFYP